MKSIDGGVSWKAISLVGKVDFHFLEGAKNDLYGVDSQSGNLMYSRDSGNSWSSLGTSKFTDIAVSPTKPAMAIALKDSKLLLTENAFKTTKELNSNLNFTQIEWRKTGLFALSGNSLYKSINVGKTWTKLSEFTAAAGMLSASEKLMLVIVGSSIYTSTNSGKSFKVLT